MKASERKKAVELRRTSTDQKVRLWCKDDWKTFDVYRVPVEALMLHVDNHRFQAERKLVQSKLGRELDPENIPEDVEALISILLDNGVDVDGDQVVGKETKDAAALRADWQARGQETPFWIRPDGTVRNGNRRLAMLLRLRGERGVQGLEFVDAVILVEKEVNERDLFEMEQREQLTENLKIRYTDINLLLTLKAAADARKIDWNDPDSIDDVATQLQHVAKGNKGYAAIQLRAIKYMDLFLQDAGKPGEYQDLLRQVERFRDIGKVMLHMETDYPDDAPDMLRLTFAAIRAGNKHEDIRAFKRIFVEDRPRYRRLLASITKEEEKWEGAGGGARLAEPQIISKPPDEDDEEEDDEPGPVVPNYPQDRVSTAIKNAVDGFQAAQRSISSILITALDRLEALDARKLKDALEHDDDGEIAGTLRKLIEWSEVARSVLPKKAKASEAKVAEKKTTKTKAAKTKAAKTKATKTKTAKTKTAKKAKAR
ncbi:hypothetical protein [Paraliomyxa miuraensis]|uniref:hypothetical protein n=1 Tax=Paraliomyxa miuraensis TaxID=376150 RepID=UPI00225400AF|nr:hypothetical protein [Paraliomyxa miuraensis]MCX4239640.1 hypothetical protein [Paraliomyxa miuraensis]